MAYRLAYKSSNQSQYFIYRPFWYSLEFVVPSSLKFNGLKNIGNWVKLEKKVCFSRFKQSASLGLYLCYKIYPLLNRIVTMTKSGSFTIVGNVQPLEKLFIELATLLNSYFSFQQFRNWFHRVGV